MKKIEYTIKENGNEIIKDNNFLIVAFQNRLSTRLTKIFEKYSIPFNKNKIIRTLDEYFTNNLFEMCENTIDKYIDLLLKYNTIIRKYVDEKVKSDVIKRSTMDFIEKISAKNNKTFYIEMTDTLVENMKSMIYVYDNRYLNDEIIQRIIIDSKEIIEEINRNNFNYVVETINIIIKDIIGK